MKESKKSSLNCSLAIDEPVNRNKTMSSNEAPMSDISAILVLN